MTAARRNEPLDPVELAAELIRRPSVTPKDEGALPYLAGVLERLGFSCRLQEFTEPGTEPVLNLYARIGTRGRNLCFAGHTDVVPPGNLAAWGISPFAGRIEGDALHGRGAADMKGAIACFAAACARFLAERGASFDGSISLLITGDEEGVSINGTKKLLEWITARGERLDACVVGEPTNARVLGDMVKIGRRGSMNGYLTVEGVQGHTAYPHLADNAAHRLVAMLQALLASPLDDGTAHFQPSTLQIATIDIANTAPNVIPGLARATLNIRFNDRWTSDSLKDWLKRKLDAVGGRYTLDFHVSGESFLTPPGAFSALVASAIERVTGRTPELGTTGGTSDARFIQSYCPIAEFGLVGLTMHKVDEQVPLADMAALTEIYRTLLDLYFPAA
ncbi:MAG TPA: succinyl-diaminopimelate desuccinylase [Stellaceae bacterium]|nr:succinyl-diaminopimelate desuccinylase [Stellaceae bacterium]